MFGYQHYSGVAIEKNTEYYRDLKWHTWGKIKKKEQKKKERKKKEKRNEKGKEEWKRKRGKKKEKRIEKGKEDRKRTIQIQCI
jgi:hypothetical protein